MHTLKYLFYSLILIAPMYTFAADTNQDIRVMYHQVYSFEHGMAQYKITSNGNSDYLDGEFVNGSPISAKCTKNPVASICRRVSYNILMQNSEIAVIRRLIWFQGEDSLIEDIFLIRKPNHRLIKITDRIVYLDSGDVGFGSMNNETIFHENRYSNEDGGFRYLDSSTKKLIQEQGYIFIGKDKTGLLIYRKTFTADQLKNILNK